MLPKFLRSDYPIQKHVLLVPLFAYRVIGFDPETKVSIALCLWAFFNWAVLVYGDYVELYFGVYYLGIDPIKGLDALCPVLSSIMSLVKVTVIWWHRDEFAHIFKRIRELTAAQVGDDKLQVKQSYFPIATKLSALVGFFGMCTSTAYTLRPIIKNIYNYVKGKPFAYETPFNMLFPDQMLAMPLYPLTFLFSHWHGYVTVLAFVGTDGLMLGMGFYFATLLKSLQVDLKRLLYDRHAGGKQALTEAETIGGLADVIERHIEIAALLRTFSRLMEEIVLAHFILSIITIGTCIIDLMLLSGYGALLYVIHACAVVTQLFLYSLSGSAIIEASEHLATVAYSSYWYTHSVRVQKMVLLLMIRSQRSFILKVPFFAPSMEVFMSILRASGSLIALIKSVVI